jgi:hypothetical protein
VWPKEGCWDKASHSSIESQPQDRESEGRTPLAGDRGTYFPLCDYPAQAVLVIAPQESFTGEKGRRVCNIFSI